MQQGTESEADFLLLCSSQGQPSEIWSCSLHSDSLWKWLPCCRDWQLSNQKDLLCQADTNGGAISESIAAWSVMDIKKLKLTAA